MVEKFGVRPAQVVDVLALMGDTIDNVKGVPGIGEKGARDLIATYGSLDALLEQRRRRQAEAVSRRRCSTHADQARHSRELVTHPHGRATCRSNAERFRYRGRRSRERCYDAVLAARSSGRW